MPDKNVWNSSDCEREKEVFFRCFSWLPFLLTALLQTPGEFSPTWTHFISKPWSKARMKVPSAGQSPIVDDGY